jgi:hypothetical protein
MGRTGRAIFRAVMATASYAAKAGVYDGTAKIRERLSLGTWTGRDGEAKAGLTLAAWEVQPMGQIGRRSARYNHAMKDAVPFDDPLRF